MSTTTYREIPLTRGLVALVDADDFERINAHKWHAKDCGGLIYAVRSVPVGNRRMQLPMSRAILPAPQTCLVDHISGQTLDNRKSNLRLAEAKNNSRNARTRPGRSGYRGVTWDTTGKSWRAYIKVDGKRINLGNYKTIDLAVEAYDQAAKELHGEFAVLNCPEGRAA